MRIVSLTTFKFFVVLSWSLLGPASLLAQVDPASSLLLRSRGSQSSELDSSRYTVKPAPKTPQPPPQDLPKELPQKKYQASDEDNKVPQTLIQTETKPVSGGAEISNPSTEEKEPDDQNIASQVKELLLGGTNDSIAEYRNMLNARDTRLNMIEVTLAPAFLYVDSQSSFWPRNYLTSGLGLHADAKIWLTPFFGLQSTYLTSIGTSIKDNVQGTSYSEADHQYIDAGLRFRNFFGLSRKAPSLTFGLDYKEYKLTVPKDDPSRVRLVTTGFRLSAEAQFPKNERSVLMAGIELTPRASHKEVSTGTSIKSGDNNETDSLGIWIGKKYVFDRKNQIYWKLSHIVERNVFHGDTNQVDPDKGVTLEGVTVTNGMTALEFGYTWGD